MEWNDQQRQIAESILRYRREDDTYSRKAVMKEIPSVVGSTITKVAKALRENNWEIPPLQEIETLEEVKTAQGGNIVNISQRNSGTILFSLGDVDISLEPKKLYDAFLYYQDILKLDPSIDDSFSLSIRTAMKHIWEHFCHS